MSATSSRSFAEVQLARWASVCVGRDEARKLAQSQDVRQAEQRVDREACLAPLNARKVARVDPRLPRDVAESEAARLAYGAQRRKLGLR